MIKKQIIFDCDPGLDDAIALLMAMASPQQLEILGLTTCAGNVPVSTTERNARMICEIAGREDIGVFAGSEAPLKRQLVTAEFVHGKSGLDGIEIFEPKMPLQKQHAVDFMIETLLASEADSMTLVATGPLTNIASAMIKNSKILTGIEEIVLMGGAMREGGNITPSAEFNISVDPDAADIVFNSGCKITVMGLDVSHQVLATEARRDRIKKLNNRASETIFGLLEFYNKHDFSRFGNQGVPMHDPCTVSYLLQPNLFKGKLCNITVETESELTMGHTAVDFWHLTDRPDNVTWMYQVDDIGFFELLTDRISRYSE